MLHNLKMKVDGVLKQRHATTVYHTELHSSTADGTIEQRMRSGMTAGIYVQPEQAEQEGVPSPLADKPKKGKRRDSGVLPTDSPSLKGSVVGQLSMLALAEDDEEAGTEKLASGTGEDSVVPA